EFELQHRPQDLAVQPEYEAERREVAEDHVLRHVEEEEVLLAERVDRRVERQHDETDPGPKEPSPPRRYRPALRRERPRSPQVEARRDDGRHHLERLERPRAEKRR